MSNADNLQDREYSLIKEVESPQIFEKSECVWIIHTFSEISQDYKTGSALSSSIFPKTRSKYKWKLRFFPNGNFDQNSVELQLELVSEMGYGYDRAHLDYTLLLKNSQNEIRVLAKRKCEESINRWIYCDAINRQTLMAFLSKDGILKIHAIILAEALTLQPDCSMNEENDVMEKDNPITKLSLDFRTLFQSQKFSDFVIKFDDSREIPVHKIILAARSPVFSAMFEHDTSENRNGYTKITDIDKDTMHRLLYFVYTGCIGDLSVIKAQKLLFAADKYELEDLKQLCTESLLQNLDVSNALDILQLAELHRVVQLKKGTADYVVKHFHELYNPKSFHSMGRKFPELLTELLIMAKNDKLN